MSIVDDYPEFIESWWDYSGNESTNPNDITKGSNKVASWVCPDGHKFMRKVASMVAKQSCPVCSGQVVVTGVNDLFTTRPDLKCRWSGSNTLDPLKISHGSGKKVLWVCGEGHEWESSVNNIVKGNGCPFCSGRYVLPGENDLASNYPQLVSQYWDFERNTADPSKVHRYSNKKAYWLCDYGHSWYSLVCNVVQGSRCPKCANRADSLVHKTLAERYPDVVASLWDYESNAVTPEEVKATSRKKVKWCCAEGHRWEDSVAKTTGSGTCPYCASTRAIPGETDLRTLHTDIVQTFWDYSRNSIDPGTIHPYSNKSVSWLCPEGHRWSARVNNVINGTRCPYCAGRQVIRGETGLLDKMPELVEELWDYSKNTVDPAEVSVASGTKVHWKCQEGHMWESMVHNVTRGSRCPTCANHVSSAEREIREFVESLANNRVTIINNDRTVLGGRELDIYIPEMRWGIEYNGNYFHSTRYQRAHRDADKVELAHSLGVDIYVIWEDEWANKKDIVKRHIEYKLGLATDRVYARKCTVSPISREESRKFLDEFHIQGSTRATHHIGLHGPDGTLIAVTLFKSRNTGDLELVRYATSKVVVGGHSKMVAYAEANYSYRNLVTFADLGVSRGSLYETTGWLLDRRLSPDYKYLISGERVHKFNYRKSRFRADPNLEYNPEMSESQLAELNGLYRIYDCGKLRYIKPHPAQKETTG